MRVVQACHVDVTSGHFGVTKTVARIKERFMWKGILRNVKRMIAACDVCQKSSRKPLSSHPELRPVPIHSPCGYLAFVGPITPPSSGNRFILTLSDYYTKWVDAVPLPNQGKEFRSSLDKEMTELLGIKRQFTTPYHPQAPQCGEPALLWQRRKALFLQSEYKLVFEKR
ncbi:hypothetical protein EMCRGX_G009382 [Ephydatia muelleri]